MLLDLKQIFDLSHTIIPGEEEFRLELDSRMTDEWPTFSQYQRPNNEWYLISEVTMNTHVGTHIEFPYHHVRDGKDAATFPLEMLVGDGVVIDISQWGHNDRISLGELEVVVGDLLRQDDIAYFYTGLDKYYRTEKQHNRPWFTTEAIEWLAHRVKIRVMGVDTSGIEVRNPDGSASIGQPNHEVLLEAGIPLVEHMTNLRVLVGKRFQTFILPVKITGAEAFPVRVIAIKEETVA